MNSNLVILSGCQRIVRSPSGVTRVGVTRGGNWWVSPYFFLEKSDDLFSHRLWKWWPFLAVVSSPLPSSHAIYPVAFFLSSATKINFTSGVTPGGCHAGRSTLPLSPGDSTGVIELVSKTSSKRYKLLRLDNNTGSKCRWFWTSILVNQRWRPSPVQFRLQRRYTQGW